MAKKLLHSTPFASISVLLVVRMSVYGTNTTKTSRVANNRTAGAVSLTRTLSPSPFRLLRSCCSALPSSAATILRISGHSFVGLLSMRSFVLEKAPKYVAVSSDLGSGLSEGFPRRLFSGGGVLLKVSILHRLILMRMANVP